MIIKNGDESAFDFISGKFKDMPLTFTKINAATSFADYLNKVSDINKFKKGVDMIVDFRDEIPASARPQTDPLINTALKSLADKREAAGAKEMADYVKSKLPAVK